MCLTGGPGSINFISGFLRFLGVPLGQQVSTGQEFLVGTGCLRIPLICSAYLLPDFHCEAQESPWATWLLPLALSIPWMSAVFPGCHKIMNTSFKLVKGKANFACGVNMQLNFFPLLLEKR